jgi:hypothetical protein
LEGTAAATEFDWEGMAVSQRRREALRRQLILDAVFSIVFASVIVVFANVLWRLL